MKLILTLAVITLNAYFLHSQKVGVNTTNPTVTFEVNGKMRVGDDTDNSVPSGTIRFNPETGDFEGWDGNQWNNFSPDPRENFWPAYGNRGAIGSYFDYSPDDAGQGDGFGKSVDIYGNYAVVGAPFWNGGQGRVFVFKREPLLGIWSVMDTIIESVFPDYPVTFFGYAVAIYGDRIVVGAPLMSNEFSSEFGVVSVYKRNGNNWEYETSLAPYNYCKEFGFDVDIYENNVIAGCPQLCSPCSNPDVHYGAITFKIDGSGPPTNIQPIAKNSLPTSVTRFGHAVSISGDWIAVSNPFSNPTPAEDSVYLYKKNVSGIFDNIQTIGNGTTENEFGYAISMHDDKMLIGERKRDGSPMDDLGEITMYINSGSTWSSHISMIGSDSLGMLGHAVACSATHQLISGYQDPTAFTPALHSLKLNSSGIFDVYVDITDPMASFYDHKISDISVHGNNFIIGVGEGISSNGQYGGRVFFGIIR